MAKKQLTVDQLAERLTFSRDTTDKLLDGRINVDTSWLAVRLKTILGGSTEFWMDLGKKYTEAKKAAKQ